MMVGMGATEVDAWEWVFIMSGLTIMLTAKDVVLQKDVR